MSRQFILAPVGIYTLLGILLVKPALQLQRLDGTVGEEVLIDD